MSARSLVYTHLTAVLQFFMYSEQCIQQFIVVIKDNKNKSRERLVDK